jgi:hypothetical protein
MILSEWAAQWRIPADALADLSNRVLNLDGGRPQPAAGLSEAAIQARVRVEASKRGMRVWRNNVGATQDHETGSFIRYGLANDSAAVNSVVKSADLVGIRPRIIQPQDVGSLIGQFVSYEVKRAGWSYTGTDREKAQAAWATLVLSMGGDARFITGEGQI